MIVSSALLLLLHRCAPNVAPRTMAAIVAHESGGRPFAIGDNTTRRSYFPQTLAQAQALAGELERAGHNLDVGYAQVNLTTAKRLGADAQRALEPCFNLTLAARVLGADYAAAHRRYRSTPDALMHALGAYNSGSFTGPTRYAQGVRAQALRLRRPARR